tara:strand:- start:2249 stop:2911 length:663 start_codon:yes stop_codon:yes gene_type:complete
MKKYYINLDFSIKRKEFMEKNYENIIRIEAYNGKNLKKYNDIILPKECEQTNNELACSLSHIKAIITAYNNNDNEALIFEDDTSNEYKNKWKKNIEDIIRDAPKDIECISFFCSNINELRKIIKLKNHYSLYNPSRWSTGCYYINRKGIEKIYNKYYKNNKIDLSLKLKHYSADKSTIYGQLQTYNYTKPTYINKLFGSIIGNNSLHEKNARIFISNYFK